MYPNKSSSTKKLPDLSSHNSSSFFSIIKTTTPPGHFFPKGLFCGSSPEFANFRRPKPLRFPTGLAAVNSETEARIINGEEAAEGAWPWQVSGRIIVFFSQSQSAVCLRCCFVASLAALPAVLRRSCTINRKSLFPGKHACEPYNPSSHTARVPACRLYITRPSVFCHPAGHRTLA